MNIEAVNGELQETMKWLAEAKPVEGMHGSYLRLVEEVMEDYNAYIQHLRDEKVEEACELAETIIGRVTAEQYNHMFVE